MFATSFLLLSSALVATSAPISTIRADFHLQNGLDAQKLNAQFKSFSASSSCTSGDQACIGGSFAQCANGKFTLTACPAGTVCAALPLVNKAGTSISCDTESDVVSRIAATGATGGVDGSGSGSTSSGSSSESEDTPAPAASSDDDNDDDSTTSSSASTTSSSSADFHLQNGLDAQKLNAKFASLTASSACTDGEQACIGGAFAECANGAFALQPCSGGTICAALPLVNKAGTSITCDTKADAIARIAQTGATGGFDGSGSDAAPAAEAEGGDDDDTAETGSDDDDDAAESSSDDADPDCDSDSDSDDASEDSTAAASTDNNTASASDFHVQNGIDAQKLNAKFASLTASSSCTDGEQACIGDAFAICANGKFVLQPCSGGTICAALPLVNKPGTSITCDTKADAIARIAQAGATGGFTGSD